METQLSGTKILMNLPGFYRAFNSEHFDKKKFLKSFYFHENKFKILWAEKNENPQNYSFSFKIVIHSVVH